MNEINILMTSVGRRVSLVKYFKRALNELCVQGLIITTDMQNNAPAACVSDIHILVPRVTEPEYIPHLLKICRENNIHLLVPLIDTELHLLSIHKIAFEEINVRLLVSSEETNRICHDKRQTALFFKEKSVLTPVIYSEGEILNQAESNYPLLIKPANGSSSIGVTKIRNDKELIFFNEYIPNAIIQEYIQGEEFTIDVLVDFEGKVRVVVPRLRLETRAGEVSKGITVKNYDIMLAAKQIVEALPGAVGCITIQCFLTESSQIKFIEINPRFGGGIPLAIHAGADFPKWIIQLHQGKRLDLTIDNWQDGVVMLRYDDEIFLNKEQLI